MKPVLVVDDEPHVRAVVSHWVESFGYRTHQAADADTALSVLQEVPASVAVCDVRMPGRDGLWLTSEIRGRHPETAVILATGADDGLVAKRGRDLGAMDYLVKPFSGDRLAGAIRRGIDWHRDAAATRQWIDRLRAEQIDRRDRIESLVAEASANGAPVLQTFVDWRLTEDPQGYAASERIMRYAAATAQRLGQSADEIRVLEAAALLHDVGLLTMPPDLMGKPADFTGDERALVRQHPLIAFNLLQRCAGLEGAASVVLSAYEAYSGGGYPQGLAGPEIPLSSRVLAVAIAYHGMMTRRPHRAPMPSGEAVLELFRCREAQFDPAVVEAFVQMLTAN